MKKVLFIASALMFLASCGESKKETTGGEVALPEMDDMKFAYYIKDSVPTNFTYFMEAQAQIDTKLKAFEQRMYALQMEGQQLLDKYQRQQAAGLLSQNDIASYEQKIAQKQNQLQVLQQTEGAELERESMNGNIELIEKMEKYGKEYAKEHGITVFLAAESAGAILYIDSTMNVTMDFIEYMNKREEEGTSEE